MKLQRHPLSLLGVTVVVGVAVTAAGCSAGTDATVTVATTPAAAAAAPVWTITPTPNRGVSDNCLAAVSGYARGGVWAVGGRGPVCYGRAAIEQRPPGGAWRVVPAGGLAGYTGVTLRDVTAVSPSDAWAVGSGFFLETAIRPVLEHWDGSAWTRVPTMGGFRLNALARVPGTSHVWAVGWNSDSQPVNLAGYWNGTNWRLMTIPAPPQGPGPFWVLFSAVAAVSENDVWAIASADAALAGDVGTVYAEHWNGQRWTPVRLPQRRAGADQLLDADAVPHTTQVGSRAVPTTPRSRLKDADRALPQRTLAGRAQPQPRHWLPARKRGRDQPRRRVGGRYLVRCGRGTAQP